MINNNLYKYVCLIFDNILTSTYNRIFKLGVQKFPYKYNVLCIVEKRKYFIFCYEIFLFLNIKSVERFFLILLF